MSFPKIISDKSNKNNESNNIILTTIGTTSIAVCLVYIVTYKVIWYIGRKKADAIVQNVKSIIKDGPLIDTTSEHESDENKKRQKVLTAAIKRARKWKTYQRMSDASPMTAQVGGISLKRVKRRVLALPPEYALKPLHEDGRGVREVAFYEALKYACVEHKVGNSTSTSTNSNNNNNDDNHYVASLWHSVFVWDDKKISPNDVRLVSSIKCMKKEIQILRRLATFAPSYYGVVGQDESRLGVISPDAYLLLNDLTVNFSKPCVLDLKIGCTSYEPDATNTKKQHELSKYEYQSTFGFRIVGMRIYDPTVLPNNFRIFDKTYGRSLNTFDDVVNAFKLFFKQPCLNNVDQIVQDLLSKRGIKNKEDATNDNTQDKDSNSKALFEVSKYDVDELRNKLNAGCNESTSTRHKVITNLTPQLHRIKKVFEDNDMMLSFISSSILIIYEGDITADNPDRANLRMIDFGHVRRQAGGDSSYLYGVKQVMNIFALLQQKNQHANTTPALNKRK